MIDIYMKKLFKDILIMIVVFSSGHDALSQDKVESIDLFKNHYKKITQIIVDDYGVDSTSMWLSSWDLGQEKYPFDFSHPDSIPCRVYLDRSVDAPGGSTLYWSLPDIAAAVELSEILRDPDFKLSARNYVGDYLRRCTAKNGVILWGNHYYYDVIDDRAVKFKSSEDPRFVDFEEELGDLHELRPLLPPWELLYQWFPERVDDHIRKSSIKHIVDFETGEFNRHANQLSEYAFIEAGSIIINSLAFLYSKTRDESLLKMADLVVDYSFRNRNPTTGLVINSPSRERWDQFTSTTEIGLWSLNILKALEYVPDQVKQSWTQIVEKALEPWLLHGFDDTTGMYYGALNVKTGDPIEKTNDYPYQPQIYADIWNPLFPTHNYPMHFAESCLFLFEMTDNDRYKMGADRWVMSIRRQLEDRRYSGALYAENYARIIHFLNRYGEMFNNNQVRETAIQLADKAMDQLYVEESKMFRSHTREMRYDCVDGIGLLFFAINELQTGNCSEYSSSFF